MAKKNTTRRKSKSKARKSVLERINPNAAGIDIGANFHLVAIPEDRAEENIRKFGPLPAICTGSPTGLKNTTLRRW